MDIKAIFDGLTLNQIDEYISNQQEETLHLEFKSINNANLKSSDDKRNLAKALSGFANSDGGIIIWGVDARKNDEGVDCAGGTKEISQLNMFISRLQELTGEAVNPLVDGVLHKEIARDAGKGFAASYIPPSDAGPHMAKLGEDHYFKRSGDGFYRMEHYDIEDMFGRRRKPVLRLVTSLRGIGMNAEIVIGIKNTGRGPAKAPYLAFEVSRPFQRSRYGLDGNTYEGMKRFHPTVDGFPNRYGEGSGFVIHPGLTHEVTVVSVPHTSIEVSPVENVVIKYIVAAEDMRFHQDTVVVQLV